ncbi:MAG: tRNA pseudouridine(38-40) synthase TruA [Microthrixaceae bacterium]
MCEQNCEEPPEVGGSCASGKTRVCLRMSYHGGAFRGFAENRDVRTVAGELRPKLEKIYRQPIVLTCAGRTDAGVHARDQAVTFDVVDSLVEPARLRKSLNSFLAPNVVVRSVEVVDPRFDARYAALWRRYRYTVLNTELPDPFMADSAWWVHEKMDLDAMNQAVSKLIGLHDFSTFCRRATTPNATMMRRLLLAEWAERPTGEGRPPVLQFDIAASAFCHQMVRSIVGFSIDIGRGHFRVDQVSEILEGRDRSLSGNIAPPQGLCLWEVGYPGDPEPPWLRSFKP